MTTLHDELRTAAKTIRDAAEHAGGQTWIADHFPEGTVVRPANSTRSLFRLAADGTRAAGTPNVAAPIGEYIAATHPGIGLALGDWLAHAADTLHAGRIHGTDLVICEPCCEQLPCQHIRPALAVARAINDTTHPTA